MAKRVFARPFQGVRDKEIYPTEFKAGDVCPPELLEAAEACEVLEPEDGGGEKGKGKSRKSVAAPAQTGDGTAQTPAEAAAGSDQEQA